MFKPLRNKKIIVTRSTEQASNLTEALKCLGANVIQIPVIKISPPKSYKQLDSAIRNIETFEWVIFTSANAVKYFLARFKKIKRDIKQIRKIKIAAIGESTKTALEEKNLDVHFVPTKFNSETFVKEFPKKHLLTNRKILIPKSNIGRDFIENELKKLNANVVTCVTYRNEKIRKLPENIKKILKKEKIDLLVFTSPSTVENFFALNLKPREPKIASIGPATSEALKKVGYKADIVAKNSTIKCLVDSIVDFYGVKKWSSQ